MDEMVSNALERIQKVLGWIQDGKITPVKGILSIYRATEVVIDQLAANEVRKMVE